MASPDSDWSVISFHEQQVETARKKQEMIQESITASVANLSHRRRLGTSRTHYQMEQPPSEFGVPPPPPLDASTTVSAPIPIPAAAPSTSRRSSKKPPPTAFPKTEENEKFEQPSKGQSLGRKIRTSLLGGKNPFLMSKNGGKEKPEPIMVPPVTLSPEPDTVVIPYSVDSDPNVAQAPQSAPPTPPKPSRQYQPPPVTSQTHPSYSSQPQRYSRGSSSTTLGQSSRGASTPELVQLTPELPPSKPRAIPIVELPSARLIAQVNNYHPSAAPQTHRSTPGKAVHASVNPGPIQPEIRPLPQLPGRQPAAGPSTSRSYQNASAALNALVNPIAGPLPTPPAVPPTPPVFPQAPAPVYAPAPAAMPVLEPPQPPPTVSARSYYRDTTTSHTTSSPPSATRYQASADRTSRGSRTSQATSATTPSLSSNSKTHASTSDRHVPPEGMERSVWAAAPPLTRSHHAPRRSASLDRPKASANEAWNDSMAQLSLGQQQQTQYHQPGYHVEIISNTRDVPPPTNEATRPRASKLQRQATVPASAPPAVVSYVYYDPEPPLIAHSTRLSDLKDDYRNPGSERSDIIRRKINYLRFELGYTWLRRSRGDGNCFYRSFAFAYLSQIYFADDRAVAVVSALENLEIAHRCVEAAGLGHPQSHQTFAFIQDLIRGMELRKTDPKLLLKIFQSRKQSDDIVAYVRLITSAYIRITPDMHAHVFHPDDPTVVISPYDFCSIYVEQLGQDADHTQISALSRALNVSIYIYRLDESVDGKAPNEQDIPAICNRLIPPDLPPVTDPVTLLFRPGHYDILERDREAR
ncbi:hypothetical protein FRC12_005374 [Ceratobasidium sp. 428]|nr:hypothetical protein FRC12_005374 [Ceratobasidium sp. 428]